MTRHLSGIRSAGPRAVATLVAAVLPWSCGATDGGERAPATVQTASHDSAPPAGSGGTFGASNPSPRDSALVAYTANEGLMLVASGKTVLIDALFREGVSGYETPTASMLEAMERGIGAFSGVELVLASHHHPDHFEARSVLRHLRNNPLARFVSTTQAAALLEAASAGVAGNATPGARAGSQAGVTAVLERVTGVWPEEGGDTVLTFGDIELRALHLHHGRDFDPPVENLGLLLDVGGFKVLHAGDTEAGVEDFAAYRLAEEGIHLAFLPYWKLLEDEGGRLVREIGAEVVVAIHVPAVGAPTSWFGTAGTRAALVAELKRTVPGVIVLVEPGEMRQIGYWPADPRRGEPAAER